MKERVFDRGSKRVLPAKADRIPKVNCPASSRAMHNTITEPIPITMKQVIQDVAQDVHKETVEYISPILP